MRTNQLKTANGIILSIELKSCDDMDTDEFKSISGENKLLGLTGIEEDDKQEMMWQLADGELNMGQLMTFINHFTRSAIYIMKHN